MPRLNDPTMEEFKNIGNYGFSACKISELGSAEYTLCNIVVDASGSVQRFEAELENALKETIRACQLSPRADSLMIRVVKFNNDFHEIHGFKLLEKINLDDYNGCIQAGGGTLLYDSVVNATDATTAYAQSLFGSDFKCNAINVVLTDGDDNLSKFGKDSVKESMVKATSSEALESLVSILVGVNVQNSTISQYLKELKNDVGFTQYVELNDASAKTLAKLADFVSKSISAVSASLGTGGSHNHLHFDNKMTENNTESDVEENEYDEYTKALFAIWEECTWPSENAITDVRDCTGKTVKFAQTTCGNPDKLIIAFTDDTFLFITEDYPRLRTSVEMNIPRDLDSQDLICDAGLVSRETLNKYNDFFKNRELIRNKELELEKLKELLEKYPEFK